MTSNKLVSKKKNQYVLEFGGLLVKFYITKISMVTKILGKKNT